MASPLPPKHSHPSKRLIRLSDTDTPGYVFNSNSNAPDLDTLYLAGMEQLRSDDKVRFEKMVEEYLSENPWDPKLEKRTERAAANFEMREWEAWARGVFPDATTSSLDQLVEPVPDYPGQFEDVVGVPYVSPRNSLSSRSSFRRTPEHLRMPRKAEQLYQNLSAILARPISGPGLEDVKAPLQKAHNYLLYLERERPVAYQAIFDVVAELVVSRLAHAFGRQVSPSIKKDRILLSELPDINSPVWKKYLMTAQPSTNGNGHSEPVAQQQSNGYGPGGRPETLKMEPGFYSNGRPSQHTPASRVPTPTSSTRF